MSAQDLPAAVRRARHELRERGWTYRTAAAECGVCYQHLSEVLNGHRKSRRLLGLIAKLPKREGVAA
jgi:lambda repressor-like predicted transcriptional regulator